MRKLLQSQTIATALAIFSMLFGAGNLFYPIMVGVVSGEHTVLGMIGFLLTAVLLPVVGLVGMILFDGNYRAFFNRLGSVPGALFIGACMIIIGPLIALPRIITLSHIMMAPFIPEVSGLVFAVIFLGLTFLCAFRENKIVDLLGRVISPLLLLSLAIIIFKGLIMGNACIATSKAAFRVFGESFMLGYGTLDLLGGLFFSSIVLTILKNTAAAHEKTNHRLLAARGLQAGLIGGALLALVYVGLSMLGLYYGCGLESLDGGQMFREVSFRVLGARGALIIGTAVLMACLSTSIALVAVVGEYLQRTVFCNKITFIHGLIIVSVLSIPLAIYGLKAVLALTGGAITFIGYPILIVLTLCNIAHKLTGFNPVKVPVALTAVVATALYIWVL